MTEKGFDPAFAVGNDIKDYDRKQLCEFASKLCRAIRAEVGSGDYRGGIFPDNISIDSEGEISIGPAAEGDWKGQELDCLAPEVYWNGKPDSASDVYSVGLVLYYAVNGGKFPFDGICQDPQLRRMGGEPFAIPKTAGRRMSEVIAKATSFKAEDRYRTVEEMGAVIDSCLKNLYHSGVPSSEAIFNKKDDDLNELERMMVNIIEKDDAPAVEEPEALSEPEEDIKEDIKVYKPELVDGKQTERKEPEAKQQDGVTERSADTVPLLFEEKNPELEPVKVVKTAYVPAAQYAKSMEREKKIAEEVKKRRRRPVEFILVLCAFLVLAAIVFNAMRRDIALRDKPGIDPANDSEASAYVGGTDIYSDPGSAVITTPIDTDPAETPLPEDIEPKESTYQVFTEDVSWTEARDKCQALGGHLVVISDEAEYAKIVQLIKDEGLKRVWIGLHRVEGTLVWENTDEVTFYNWDEGEPSEYDDYDGSSEDYVMLWYHDGWYYNDSRNDPVAEYPQWYRGTISYICEFDG